jgi:hypothetical protein
MQILGAMYGPLSATLPGTAQRRSQGSTTPINRQGRLCPPNLSFAIKSQVFAVNQYAWILLIRKPLRAL